MPKLISQMFPKIQKKRFIHAFWLFFISTAMIWFRLKRLHGCCLRSAPARSGASQFAPWASAAVSHETRYHTKCHIQPETREVVHASCRRQLLHSVADNGFFHMDAACGRRPLAQVLRNSFPGHPPLSATTRRYHNKCHIQPES